jgi:hypothetical protein
MNPNDQSFIIKPTSRDVVRGNFGVVIDVDTTVMHVPEIVFKAAASFYPNLRTGFDLLDAADHYPTQIASNLGWSYTEVIKAKDALRQQMSSHTNDERLAPAPTLPMRNSGTLPWQRKTDEPAR